MKSRATEACGMTRREFERLAIGGAMAGAATGGASRLYGRTWRNEAARPAVFATAVGDVRLRQASQGRPARCSAILWAKTDRAARMHVEWSTTPAFDDARRVRGGVALPTSDGTTKLLLEDLPEGQSIFYRLHFADLAEPAVVSPAAAGGFRTPTVAARDVRFHWGGDVAGQGYGIDPAFGGYDIFRVMMDRRPDFFIHSGDTIYADNPLSSEMKLDDGGVWKNIVTEAKASVAQTLDAYRGNHAYNLLDEHYRRYVANVAVFAQWDDHDVLNNWFPGQTLDDKRFSKERRVDVLAAYAKRAFLDYHPIAVDPSLERVYRRFGHGPLLDVFHLDMRSYRGRNTPGRQTIPSAETAFLGDEQLAWLIRGLTASKAVWKVVAADMPLGMIVPDGPRGVDAVANGDGPPTGRELEFATLLSAMKKAGVRNVVWITADIHYAAAHHYSPERARFTDFDPFWEFVAGPLHAGTFGPGKLDDTFGPAEVFRAIPPGMKANRPPSQNLQFFGQIDIDAKSKHLSVSLNDRRGTQLWNKSLEPVGV